MLTVCVLLCLVAPDHLLMSITVLNYALTLEHLEDKFYREGLANYTQEQFAAAGFDETFYNNLKEVSVDEQTHVKFLTDALTGTFVMVS